MSLKKYWEMLLRKVRKISVRRHKKDALFVSEIFLLYVLDFSGLVFIFISVILLYIITDTRIHHHFLLNTKTTKYNIRVTMIIIRQLIIIILH